MSSSVVRGVNYFLRGSLKFFQKHFFHFDVSQSVIVSKLISKTNSFTGRVWYPSSRVILPVTEFSMQ